MTPRTQVCCCFLFCFGENYLAAFTNKSIQRRQRRRQPNNRYMSTNRTLCKNRGSSLFSPDCGIFCGGRGSARDNRLQSDPSDAVCMMYPAEASVGFSSCLPLLQVHDVRKRSWCLVAVSTEAFGHGSTRFPQKFPHARWALRANMNKQLEHTMLLPCDVGIR